ncbi:NAD(P)/FAD-dependent oxidoreductase [Mycoplasmatota bacterium WC30]
MMREYDVIIIGGGSAGLSSAIEIYKEGFKNILLIERDIELGGILLQCIHNGFGLKVFKEELTGPEYAERFVDELMELGIEYKLDSVVTKINPDKSIEYVNTKDGFANVKAKAIVLTMGCYERSAGAISIPGTRPAGVLTAGQAQKYLNIDGYLVGKKVFILGSGDIGLIMARRMTLEGAEVLGVAEILPFSGGLNRNIVQCLKDYDIPLYLNHTITDIIGDVNLEKIVLTKVDNFQPIPGTEKEFEVDTLLLSIGLIPENEISENAGIILDGKTKGPIVDESYQTSKAGVFACGNALHVHDLVDFVTEESRRTGRSVARYLKNELKSANDNIQLLPADGISYIVPQNINVSNIENKLELFMRVTAEYKNVSLVVYSGDTEIKRMKKRHMAPAEMEKVILTKADLSKVTKTLSIKVVG